MQNKYLSGQVSLYKCQEAKDHLINTTLTQLKRSPL